MIYTYLMINMETKKRKPVAKIIQLVPRHTLIREITLHNLKLTEESC